MLRRLRLVTLVAPVTVMFARPANAADYVFAEGRGGALVPLTDDDTEVGMGVGGAVRGGVGVGADLFVLHLFAEASLMLGGYGAGVTLGVLGGGGVGFGLEPFHLNYQCNVGYGLTTVGQVNHYVLIEWILKPQGRFKLGYQKSFTVASLLGGQLFLNGQRNERLGGFVGVELGYWWGGDLDSSFYGGA
ncbi:MAG: hypothetical protein U0271_28505 [Polyangiaceae bacterium]